MQNVLDDVVRLAVEIYTRVDAACQATVRRRTNAAV